MHLVRLNNCFVWQNVIVLVLCSKHEKKVLYIYIFLKCKNGAKKNKI